MALTPGQIEQFVADGFVTLPGVVAPEIVSACMEVVWADTGVDPADPATWTRPVINVVPSDMRPFAAAFQSPRLFAALDQLAGAGRWRPRSNLGNLVVRFPHDRDTGDTGWHIDASFPPDDGGADFARWRVNRVSRGRTLLLLYLLSDVGPDDGPTRIRAGSQRDVARVLEPFGADGAGGFAVAPRLDEASRDRREVVATGAAGDVYVCHPFLVHAAQVVRGARPRTIAQPGVEGEPFRLDAGASRLTPVELAAEPLP